MWTRLFDALRHLRWSGVVAATAVLLSGAVSAAVISAGSSVVNAGDTFVIPISISGAGEITSWQFDLSFDPLLLQANSVTEGPFLSDAGLTLFIPGFIDNANGLISGVADAYSDIGPPPSGGGVIAKIEFTALANGLSPLTLSNVFLNGLDSGFDLANGAVCVGGASFTNCGTVPEPGTVVLLAAALLTLAWARRARGSLRPPMTG